MSVYFFRSPASVISSSQDTCFVEIPFRVVDDSWVSSCSLLVNCSRHKQVLRDDVSCEIFLSLDWWYACSRSLNEDALQTEVGILYRYIVTRSQRKQFTFGEATTDFPAKWRLRNERRNSTLITSYKSKKREKFTERETPSQALGRCQFYQTYF